MSRLHILFLLLSALLLSYILKRVAQTCEGLDETNTNTNEKDISFPDRPIDYNSQKLDSLVGMSSMQEDKASLQEMSPSFLSDRVVESKQKFRWVADQWPKCKNVCSNAPISRKVKCFKRNNKPYSDDQQMSSFFTVDAGKTDEFGKTKCDTARSGININVKPAENSFCSLVNSCPATVTNRNSKYMDNDNMSSDLPTGFEVENIVMTERSVDALTKEEKRLVIAAFDRTEVHTNTTSDGKPSISYSYVVEKSKLKRHIQALTASDRGKIESVMKKSKVVLRAENSLAVGDTLILI